MRAKPNPAGFFSAAVCCVGGIGMTLFAIYGDVDRRQVLAHAMTGGLIFCLGIGFFLNTIGVLPERRERSNPKPETPNEGNR